MDTAGCPAMSIAPPSPLRSSVTGTGHAETICPRQAPLPPEQPVEKALTRASATSTPGR